MELYLDKENLIQFLKSRNNPEYQDCYDDCTRMLNRQVHINYNFEKSRELLDDEILFAHFSQFNQGCGSCTPTSFSSEIFPQRPVKSNTANDFSWEQHSAIFLIDDEKTTAFAAKGNTLVGGVGEELPTLKSLFCGSDYDFHKLYDLQDNNAFPNWEQLGKDGLNLPLSDIIIMDRYLGAQNDLAEYNIFKLLDVLLEKSNSTVNVLLLCDKSYYNKNNRSQYTPDWDGFRSKIKSRLKKATGANGNVTVLFYPKNDHKHDRTIFTNYMLYRSGDSFCYFDNNGKRITNGNSLDVDSLAKKSNYDYAMSFINSIQKMCDNLKKLNNDMIIGDRISNYINF